MFKFLLNTVASLVCIGLYGAPTPITTVPTTINTPGSYIVANDLTSAGSGITIAASNVVIDFDGHILTIPDAAVDGILAQNQSNIVVKNGTIRCATQAVNANNCIRIEGTSNVTVDSMTCENTRRGIRAGIRGNAAAGNTDLDVHNCIFDLPSPAVGIRGLSLEYSQSIRVDSCTFKQLGIVDAANNFAFLIADVSDFRMSNCTVLNTNSSIGLGSYVLAINRDCENYVFENNQYQYCAVPLAFTGFGPIVRSVIIRGCTATNAGYQSTGGGGIIFLGDGLLVEDCVFEAAPSNGNLLLELGFGEIPDIRAGTNVIIKDSTFTNRQAASNFHLAWIMKADGVLIDNCVFDSNASGIFEPTPYNNPPSAVVMLGSLAYDENTGLPTPGAGTNVHNFRMVNSIIHNNAQYGIVSMTGDSIVPNKNIVIENCSIDGAAQAGIYFVNTHSSAIRNCHVKDSTGNGLSAGNGIVLANALPVPYLQAGSCRNNEINGCTVAGCTGTGILVESNSVSNFIVHNETFGNGQNGLENRGDKSNQFYENFSCNNSRKDCTGNICRKLIQTPGSDHLRLGQNICCNACE